MADWSKMSASEQINYCEEMINYWMGLKIALERGEAAETSEEKAAIAVKVADKKSAINDKHKALGN